MTEEELRANAEYAIEKLKKYRQDYKRGIINLATVKLIAQAHIDMFDRYAKLKAKQHKVSYKPFNLNAFLR